MMLMAVKQIMELMAAVDEQIPEPERWLISHS
jgi:translation elongation factor EF-Tu-like GTPase